MKKIMNELIHIRLPKHNLKTEILCKGVRTDKKTFEKFRKQNPFLERASGLGMGGYFLLPSNEFVNANIYYNSAGNSEYEIREEQGVNELFFKGKKTCEIKIIDPPNWYFQKTNSGFEFGRLIVQHGPNSLITSVYSDCQFFKQKEECKFCAIGLNVPQLDSIKRKKAIDIVEALKHAIQFNPNYKLEIQGGTTISNGSGFEIYNPIAKEIKKEISIPISIESAPPLEDRFIFETKDCGVDGLLINLEIFDDESRKKYTPGKAKRFSKKRYFEIFELAVKIFGVGKIGSCLIFGLEDIKSTINGAKTLIEYGVIPSLIPYRKVNGIDSPNIYIDTDAYFRVSKEIGHMIKIANLKPDIGCVGCTGCSAEIDFSKRE